MAHESRTRQRKRIKDCPVPGGPRDRAQSRPSIQMKDVVVTHVDGTVIECGLSVIRLVLNEEDGLLHRTTRSCLWARRSRGGVCPGRFQTMGIMRLDQTSPALHKPQPATRIEAVR